MTKRIRYEDGLSPIKLQALLFNGISEDEGERLKDKELLRGTVRHLRRQWGYPLLCTRGKNNRGEFRYYIADEAGLNVYNFMMESIENGINHEKDNMNKRYNKFKPRKMDEII